MARTLEALNGKHSGIELLEKWVWGTERRTGVLLHATTHVRTVGEEDGHTMKYRHKHLHAKSYIFSFMNDTGLLDLAAHCVRFGN